MIYNWYIYIYIHICIYIYPTYPQCPSSPPPKFDNLAVKTFSRCLRWVKPVKGRCSRNKSHVTSNDMAHFEALPRMVFTNKHNFERSEENHDFAMKDSVFVCLVWWRTGGLVSNLTIWLRLNDLVMGDGCVVGCSGGMCIIMKHDLPKSQQNCEKRHWTPHVVFETKVVANILRKYWINCFRCQPWFANLQCRHRLRSWIQDWLVLSTNTASRHLSISLLRCYVDIHLPHAAPVCRRSLAKKCMYAIQIYCGTCYRQCWDIENWRLYCKPEKKFIKHNKTVHHT